MMLPLAPWLSWALPIIGAALMPLFARVSGRLRDSMAIAFPLSALVMTASMMLDFRPHPPDQITTWIQLPQPFGDVKAGVLVDPLSILMANIVASIGFIIMVYSLGYMRGDPGITRYWFFMNFFIGSMLLLVLSDNFIQLLIGWEGVGLCSYALIGHYYRDERKHWVGGPEPKAPAFSPSHSGMKAFLMTGVGDTLMLIAIFIIFSYAKTFSFVELYETAPEWLGEMGKTPGLLVLVSALLLAGPIGKSAQFPLHEWLPEAMAGPAPVSALIHAATMVKAGVYLVARVLPIFYFGYWVGGYSEAASFFSMVAWVGAFTAFLTATQAMVALELKKALAYSTMSQIGYMMLGLGVSGFAAGGLVIGYVAGIFHLMSHAIFKANLFLGAGCVIHSSDTIYMHEMGGMRRGMPFTHLFMLIGALTLAGVPPLVGFWSKDAVLASSLVAGQHALFALAAVTAAITAFYSVRFLSMTFYGKESEHLRRLRREGIRVREAERVMWVPVGILAALAVVLGLAGPAVEGSLEESFEGFLHEVYALPPIVSEHSSPPIQSIVVTTSVAMVALGGVLAYAIYIERRASPEELVARHKLLRAVHAFLWNRWFMNPAYYRVFSRGFLKATSGVHGTMEMRVIDKISPTIAGWAMAAYHRIKRIQTGILSYNMAYVVLAFILLMLSLVLAGVI